MKASNILWLVLIPVLAFAQDTDCNWYTSDVEASWLPNRYAQAASCACTLKGLEGANSTSARCVRHRVQASHKNQDYFSIEQKNALLDMKNQYATSLFYGFKYYAFLESIQFAHTAQQIHIDAYASCGCPGNPAKLWAWELVSLLGLPSTRLCPFIIQEIEKHGPCGFENW